MKIYLLISFWLLSFGIITAQKTDNLIFSCGFDDTKLSAENLKFMLNAQNFINAKKASRIALDERYVCRIAIDVDSYTYDFFNGDTTFIKYDAIKQVERVSKIYEKEMGIRLVVSHVNIWKNKDTDPYKNLFNIYDILNNILPVWRSNPKLASLRNSYDKIVYISKKNMSGASGVASEIPCVVTWSYNNFLLAHELGHTLGSDHTQSCNWPGGPLDYCTNSEGNCYDGAKEDMAGTIMSYCSAKIASFHVMCKAVIEQYSMRYLQKQKTFSQSLKLPDAINVNTSKLLVWTPLNDADYYIIETSTDSQFRQNVAIDTSATNTLNAKNIQAGESYFMRIKGINKFGQSGWSNVSLITSSSTALLPPTIVTPNSFAMGLPYNKDIAFEFSPEKNANSYQIQLAYSFDFNFNDPIISQTINTNKTVVRIPWSGEFLCRVRTINNSDKSAWSEVTSIFINGSDNNLSVGYAADNNIVTTLEYEKTNINSAELSVVFSVSDKEDFSNIIESKAFLPPKNPVRIYTYLPKNLVAGKTYYVKVDEILYAHDYMESIPKGTLSSIKKSFTIGQKKRSNSLIFFTKDIYPEIENKISKLVLNKTSAIFQNSRGLVSIDINKLTVNVFDRDNTNGAIANQYLGLSTDFNSFNATLLQPIGKLSQYANSRNFAFRKLDLRTGVLSESKEFDNVDAIYPYDINNEGTLVYGYSSGKSDYALAKVEGNKLVTKFVMRENQSGVSMSDVIVLGKDAVWAKMYRNASNDYELWHYDFLTNKRTIYTKQELSILNVKFEDIYIDKKGVFWAMGYNSMSSFDGKVWKSFQSSTSLFRKPQEMCEDEAGNLYVYDESRILKFDGKVWSLLTACPLANLNLREMLIDANENFWFRYDNSVVLFKPCLDFIDPPTVVQQSSTTVEYGQNVILTAKGCESSTWDWQSLSEKKTEFNSPSNQINVSPTSQTVFQVRCEQKGCTSQAVSLTVNVVPIINIKTLSKKQICQGEQIELYANVKGSFNSGNTFKVQSVNSTGQMVELPTNAQTDSSGVRLLVDTKSLVGEKYWLKVKSSSLPTTSKDSAQLAITAAPQIKVTGDTVCSGQTAYLVVEGESGLSYQWVGVGGFKSNDLELVFSNSLPNNSGVYTVTSLNASGCSTTFSTRLLVNDLPKITASLKEQAYVNNRIQLFADGGKTYIWKGPNKFTSTEQNPVITKLTLENAGNYILEGYDNNQCMNTTSIQMNVLIPLGIEKELNTHFLVYPNPSTEVITTTTDVQTPVQLIMYNSIGQEVYNTIFREKITFNVKGLPRGAYFISFVSNENKETIKVRLY